MAATETTWQERIEKMDMDLKAFFDDQRSYLTLAFQSMEKRLTDRLDGHDAKFISIDDRFDKLEQRFDKFEQRFDRFEQRFDRFERDVKLGFQVVDARIRGVERRMESRFDSVSRDLAQIKRDVRDLIQIKRDVRGLAQIKRDVRILVMRRARKRG